MDWKNINREKNPDKKGGKMKKAWIPTSNTVICSAHFTQDSLIEGAYAIYGLRSLGKKMCKKLKEVAVPTYISPQITTNIPAQYWGWGVKGGL